MVAALVTIWRENKSITGNRIYETKWEINRFEGYKWDIPNMLVVSFIIVSETYIDHVFYPH